MKIIFLGTPEFAVSALKKLIETPSIKILKVITQPDKPVGRKKILTAPPVKEFAAAHNLKIGQPKSKKELLAELKEESGADFFVVIAFGMILTEEMLKLPKHGCINIHGSLLPKYRGASPIHQSLLNGDKETGVTIMAMDSELDHGNIYLLKKHEILEKDDIETLYEKLAEIGANILPVALEDIKNGDLTPIKQNHEKATFCQKITKENGKVDWTKSAEEIKNMLRAYKVWPGIFTTLNGKKLTLLEIEAVDERNKAGKIFVDQKELKIGTGKGTILVKRLQSEGKKEMPAADFINGHQNILPAKLD